MRFTTGRPPGGLIVTCSSRGIDIIEIVGLLGSMRTSSISLECGTTNPPGLFFGGGRRSSPTSSSVSGEPRLVPARILEDSLTALFWLSASTTLLTSPSAITAVAPPDSTTTPTAAASTRLASHHGRRGGSGGIGAGGWPPAAELVLGGVAVVLKRCGRAGRGLAAQLGARSGARARS